MKGVCTLASSFGSFLIEASRRDKCDCRLQSCRERLKKQGTMRYVREEMSCKDR